MHFYLLRGTDGDGKHVNPKIIAADDDDAKKKCQEIFPDISVNELLDCELISWSYPTFTRLPDGHYYLVLGKRLTYDPTCNMIDVVEKINAHSDNAAAGEVSLMYANRKITEDAWLLRCRIVERKS